MKLAIVGSRDYAHLDAVESFVNSLEKGTIVVSGHAPGVDRKAEEAALARGLGTIIFPAEWEKYGRGAGYKRNKLIVKECDALVAFWDGESKGTLHSIRLAKKAGKYVRVYQ